MSHIYIQPAGAAELLDVPLSSYLRRLCTGNARVAETTSSRQFSGMDAELRELNQE